MELQFNGRFRDTDVLVDMERRNVWGYATKKEEIHSLYGGRNTSTSRTGLTGGGYITNAPFCFKAGCFRNSSVHYGDLDNLLLDGEIRIEGEVAQELFLLSEIKRDYSLTGLHCWVLTTNNSRRHFLLFATGDEVFDVFEDLKNGEVHCDREIHIPFIDKDSEPNYLEVGVVNHKQGIGQDYMALLPMFALPQGIREVNHHIEENRLLDVLGVYKKGDKFMDITSGYPKYCDWLYEKNPLENPELLRKWHLVKDGQIKIVSQERTGEGTESREIHFVAYTKYGEEWIEYEEITTNTFYLFYKEEVLKFLRRDLRNKCERKRERIRAKNDIKEKIKFLKENHPQLKVTVEDSLKAGNCRPGTESFKENFFPGREAVKVKELCEHLNHTGVKAALLHKYDEIKEVN